MNTARRFTILILAFFLYFMTVATINFLPDLYGELVPSPNQKTIERLKEFAANEFVKNGLAAMLTALVAIVMHTFGVKETSETFEDQVEIQEARSSGRVQNRQIDQKKYVKNLIDKFERLRGNYAETQTELQQTAYNLYNVKKFARRKLRMAMIFSVTICFAISHLFAAGIQTVIQTNFPYENQSEPLQFIILFSQSAALMIFALGISFYFYRSYFRLLRMSDFKSEFLIGWCGIFTAGVLQFIQQSPELYALTAQNFEIVPYFNVPIIIYILATKLLVFPVLGLSGAVLAGSLATPSTR